MNIKGCERVKFIFSPDASHGSLHISEGGVRIDCVERERRRPICCSVCLLPVFLNASSSYTGYKRNIQSIADMMILTKSNTFVGEFTSNWGRIVRIFRTQLNDMYVIPDKSSGWADIFNAKETETLKAEPIVLVHDIRMAFAEDKAIPPPGW